RRDHPADQIDIGEHRERENKNDETDDDGEPVLADPRCGFARAPGCPRGSRFDGRHDVLLRQRATAVRSRPPSLRDSLSLNASARGGIFYFVSAYRTPVNVVDRPELSTFIFPAIVDRGEVVVAIGTGGASPVLARRLRELIEALLPARIGDLAQ